MTSRPTRFLVVVGLVLAGVLLVVIYVIPPALVSGQLSAAERLKAENDVRSTLVQVLVGGLLLAGLYFTARTLQLNREGQVTDRFSKAIDQIGSDKGDVRLGGVYALERIARDSRRDHEPVVEILTAFLREHADKSLFPPEEHPWSPPSVERSPADLIAALEVIGRREGHVERRPLDLRRIRVKGAHLEGANLRGAVLNAVELPWSYMQGADLSDATLSDADLRYSDCQGADLRESVLDDAKLTYVKWDDARLNNARLHGATYDRSQLSPEQLTVAVEGD
jgi:hypothetical protein